MVINCVPVAGVSVDVGRDVLKIVVPVNVLVLDHELVPVHALFPASVTLPAIDAYVPSPYVFVISWAPVVGVSVDVGREVLNEFVPVQTFAAAISPYVPSPYSFVMSWAFVVGVWLDVGSELLKVVVPVKVLLFDHELGPVQGLVPESETPVDGVTHPRDVPLTV